MTTRFSTTPDIGTRLGALSWSCEKQLELSSPCTHAIIIDAINALFLAVFYLLLLSPSTRSKHRRATRRGWLSISVSIGSALTGIAYFVVGFQGLAGAAVGWAVSLARGLIWISLALSLLTGGSRSIRMVGVAWSVAFFLLSTALNVELLIETHSIDAFEAMPWPVNCLLVICAFRNYSQASEEGVSEPLLGSKKKASGTGCQAGFFSRLTFSWMNALLRQGYSKTLALEDIPSLAPADGAGAAYQKFACEWEALQEQEGSKHKSNMIVHAIARVYSKEMILVGVYALLRTLAVAVSPLLLYAFVNYTNSGDQDLSNGLVLVGCLMAVKVVESLGQRHMFFNSRRSGMRMRSALMAAVYQKQLRLSSLGRRRHSAGEIVNYIAVDAYRMGEFPWWFHLSWSLALQLLLSICVLLGIVGIGAILGLVPFFVCGVLNVPFAKTLQNCQSQFMAAQDERLRSTSEILNNVKIIKLQSWENRFKSLIESLREKEFKWLAEAHFKKAYGSLLYWSSPTMVSSVVFAGCVIFHSARLDAGTIFTILATLRTMGEPAKMIPEALSFLIQAKVSLNRLSTFMTDDELNDEEIKMTPLQKEDARIKIVAGSFIWNPELTIPTLRDLDLEVKQGQKAAICGPVGAGKSSLLYAILKEIPQVSGRVHVFGSIAYVSQVAWIQSGTIRDNILYGKQMDEIRYQHTIKACALDKDISNFTHGDLTEIGQRGLNMSGGQKQRIQLARAVYNDADIYLLDDPFSAVDAHTAAYLFNDCVMAALKEKTVILVTHQVEFLSEVDHILVMEGGRVTQSGSYRKLLMAGTAFEQLVNAHNNSVTASNLPHNKGKSEKQKTPDVSEGPHITKEIEGVIQVKGLPGVQLTEEEDKETGDSGWKPFLDYFSISEGWLIFLFGMSFQAGFVVLQAAATYWLALASRDSKISSGLLIGVYTVISTLSAGCVYLRAFCTARLGLKASAAFFSAFTDAIFQAPMLFFDSTPIGRIFTRVSSDLSVLDFDIPFAIVFVIGASMELLAIIGVMVSVTWQVLIVAILALACSRYVQRYYLASAMDLVRINGMTKAPVMNCVAETSLGVVTIRAFKMTGYFVENYLRLVDIDAKLFFQSNAAMEWLVLRTEGLQNLTLITAATLLVLLPKGIVAPGLVGLSLSYAMALTSTHVFITRWYCNLSNYIISVERIKQFIHIPSEPPAIVEDKRPPSSWPSKGRIELQDLKVRYRKNAPLVLKGITCTFREGTRVGVVGRTGSGKTTLIAALFRMVEPDSGRIVIDGLETCSIGLKDLRTKLSIIPQEPTLFRGSIRSNFDPLGVYSDDEIWGAVEKCQLKATISGLPHMLDSPVSDDGDNWSTGQRQLFCLGRVLLRRNRILVLDEATASIDSATDAVLQKIIRQEFSECTVITVAHRVPTVIDSDMVMVLSYGNLVEYDQPSKLMQTNSSFQKLVAEYWAGCRRNSTKNLVR